MDDDLHDKYMKSMFYSGSTSIPDDAERSECPGVIPARERIKQYKTRQIRRHIPNFGKNQSAKQLKSGNAQSQALIGT